MKDESLSKLRHKKTYVEWFPIKKKMDSISESIKSIIIEIYIRKNYRAY